jgi:hypothetical protein
VDVRSNVSELRAGQGAHASIVRKTECGRGRSHGALTDGPAAVAAALAARGGGSRGELHKPRPRGRHRRGGAGGPAEQKRAVWMGLTLSRSSTSPSLRSSMAWHLVHLFLLARLTRDGVGVLNHFIAHAFNCQDKCGNAGRGLIACASFRCPLGQRISPRLDCAPSLSPGSADSVRTLPRTRHWASPNPLQSPPGPPARTRVRWLWGGTKAAAALSPGQHDQGFPCTSRRGLRITRQV